jgi:CysZ protein
MTHPLAPAPSGDLVPRSEPGFLTGIGSFFSGFGFLVTRPSVWLYAMVPVAVGAGITALLGGLAIAFLPAKIAAWIGATSWVGVLGTWLLKVLAGAIAVALAALVGFSLAQPLSGPALNKIATAVERELGAPPLPATTFVDDVVKGLKSVGVAYLFGLPILAVLALVAFFFPPASIVTFPLKLVIVALLVSWDLCDYPLSLRGLPIRERLAFMKRHVAAVLGFGAGLAVLSLVPCALLLVLPAGVAGATRLTVLLERSDAGARAKRPA